MRAFLLAAVIALALSAAPTAQAQFGFAPVIGYDFDYSAFQVGFVFEVPVTPSFLPVRAAIRPGAEYIFAGDDDTGNLMNFSVFRLNGDLVGRFGAPGVPISPFAKAGVAFESASFEVGGVEESNSEFGVNLGGGVEVNRIFVEGTVRLGDVSDGSVTVGYRF